MVRERTQERPSKRVRQLTPELVPAQVWHRMRHLREKERSKSATAVDWSDAAIEDSPRGLSKRRPEKDRSNQDRKGALSRDSRATWCPDSPEVEVGWTKGKRTNKREIDDRGQGKRNKELFSRARSYEPVKAIAEKLKRSEAISSILRPA